MRKTTGTTKKTTGGGDQLSKKELPTKKQEEAIDALFGHGKAKPTKKSGKLS